MKVELPPDIEEYVAKQIRAGRFADANEVVADALRFAITEEAKQRAETLPSPVAGTGKSDGLGVD